MSAGAQGSISLYQPAYRFVTALRSGAGDEVLDERFLASGTDDHG
jgi:hypothetical protein